MVYCKAGMARLWPDILPASDPEDGKCYYNGKKIVYRPWQGLIDKNRSILVLGEGLSWCQLTERSMFITKVHTRLKTIYYIAATATL
jgi:hypothetical protein